jgi:FkbM family methyltransferase
VNTGLARAYFRQLRPLHALRHLGLKIIQRVLDPWAAISYAQSGEDRIIATLLGGLTQPPGFYVDVGCNHPVRFSNTFELYKRGWRGINIDANAQLVDLCRHTRPRDVSICAVVSDAEREIVFTEFDNPLLSSVSDRHVERWREHSDVARTRRASARTLNEILRTHDAPQRFDLLSIDVEGHELEVLSALDLEAYRPKLIVVEMHGLRLGDSARGEVWSHLLENDYEMVGYAVMNGYFLDSRPPASP